MEPMSIILGDAIVKLREIPSASVGCVLTDPPYSSGGMYRGDRTAATSVKYQQTEVDKLPGFPGDGRDQRSWTTWLSIIMAETLRASKAGAPCFVFTDWRQLAACIDAVQVGGWIFRGVMVWDKINGRPQPDRPSAQCEYIVFGTNGPHAPRERCVYPPGLVRCEPPAGIVHARNERGDDRVHATQKPLQVLRWLLQLVEPGEIVLDPFCGSGSSAVAAQDMGMRFVGCEVDPYWHRVSIERGQPVLPMGVGA